MTVTLLTFSWVCAPPPHSTHTFGSIRTGFLPWSCPRRPPDDFNFATEKSVHLFLDGLTSCVQYYQVDPLEQVMQHKFSQVFNCDTTKNGSRTQRESHFLLLGLLFADRDSQNFFDFV